MRPINRSVSSPTIAAQIEEMQESMNAETQQLVKEEIIPYAAILAVDNRPYKTDQMMPYTEFIFARFQRMQAKVASNFNGRIQQFLGAADLAAIGLAIPVLEQHRDALKRELSKATIEAGEMKDIYDATSNAKHNKFIALLAVIEFILFTAAFLAIHASYLSAIAQGAALAFVQTYMTHYLTLVLRDKFKLRLSTGMLRLLVAGAIIVVCVIGAFRFLAVPAVGGSRPLFLLVLYIVSTFLMMGYTAFWTYYHHPSEADKAAQAEVIRKRQTLEKMQQDIDSVDAEIVRLAAEKKRIPKLRLEIMEAQQTLMEHLKACCKIALAAFKTTNMTKRSDGVIPDAFQHESPLPDFPPFLFPFSDNPQNK
ncbi:MAG: hypothetical protein JST90_15960 [Bacteroidetes bacterium]|nr:hypothetical protein [Bacteroidota bacterium]